MLGRRFERSEWRSAGLVAGSCGRTLTCTCWEVIYLGTRPESYDWDGAWRRTAAARKLEVARQECWQILGNAQMIVSLEPGEVEMIEQIADELRAVEVSLGG